MRNLTFFNSSMESKMRENVLFVCEGIQHLASTIALAKHLKKIGVNSCLYHRHSILDNPDHRIFKYIIEDKLAVPGLLQHVGLVIFLTHESSPFCMTSNQIGFIARKTGTNAITVQHGWIQPGLNYQSDLPKVGFTGRGSDNSPALWHFSPVLGYFGENGIGYPTGSIKKAIEFPANDSMNVLISTNLNWNVYSRENIIGLLRSLITLKQTFPFLNLLHRSHPAEKSQAMVAELGVYMETLGIDQGNWPDIDSAIDWADFVISTPSTAVFDAYFKGVPTFVYEFDGFKEALSIASGITFSNGKELTSLISKLLSEKIYSDPNFPAFKPEVFEREIRQHLEFSNEFNLTEENFLQYMAFCKS